MSTSCFSFRTKHWKIFEPFWVSDVTAFSVFSLSPSIVHEVQRLGETQLTWICFAGTLPFGDLRHRWCFRNFTIAGCWGLGCSGFILPSVKHQSSNHIFEFKTNCPDLLGAWKKTAYFYPKDLLNVSRSWASAQPVAYVDIFFDLEFHSWCIQNPKHTTIWSVEILKPREVQWIKKEYSHMFLRQGSQTKARDSPWKMLPCFRSCHHFQSFRSGFF